MKIPWLSKANEKINKISSDIKKTSDNIALSTNTINESLSGATEEIKETAQNIAKSAETIATAVENFTCTTTETIDRFESAIEQSIAKLVATIEDFKNEIVKGGIKVNIAKSAGSLVPRPEGGLVQGITSGIRDIIIPKRKPKEESE